MIKRNFQTAPKFQCNNGSQSANLKRNLQVFQSQVTRAMGTVTITRFSSNNSGTDLVYKQRRRASSIVSILMLISYSWAPGRNVSALLFLILCSLLWKWRPLLLCRRASLHCFPPLDLDSLPSSVVARTRPTPYLLSLIESELRSVYDLAIYKQITCQVVNVVFSASK